MGGESLLKLGFWMAALLVLYAYGGYPAWLLVWSWLRPGAPIRKEAITPRLTIVIAAHNEERVIEQKLRNCMSLDYPPELLEILVASDGSSDGTEEIVSRFGDERVRLLSLAGPRGKAAALNQAIAESRGQVLLLCDARQALEHDAGLALVSNLADPTVGAVSGELHISGGAGSAAGEGVGAYWRYEKLIRRLQSRIDSTVGVTGALYALRRDLFVPLDSGTILDDVAIPMEVVRAGYRVVFEPAARAHDVASATPGLEYRRKVRTLAGNYQLLSLRPWLLDPRRNRLFLHFVSHKLARLAVPWSLIAMLLCSAALAHTAFLYAAVLGLQIGFYGLGLAGWALDRLQVRASPLSFPYAFLLLNLAAATSLLRFLGGRETAAWKRGGGSDPPPTR